ncbi:MAG: UDP-3-O-(3-hydroxymyristoyl)glucosamine N-acyltransferase [Arenicella sp.]
MINSAPSIATDQLLELFPDLSQADGYNNVHFDNLASCDDYQPSSLVFCSDSNYIEALSSHPPAVIITTAHLADSILAANANCCVVLITADTRLSQALIKQKLDDYDPSDSEWPAIHPSATIHDSATIGLNCRIGPNVVIGANVVVGDHCIIRANTVVEHDVTLGQHCVIHSMVNIGYATQIGHRVIIRPGTTIANEGFGLAPDVQKHYHRLPHTGTVVIGDDVQIGANCNIDRGTYGSTVIERGVKIDALCHIAHNVKVGADTVITAQCVIAGSSTIGQRVLMSGQTGVLDHKSVADDAVLVHRCGVTEDITSAGIWAGTPAKPFKDYVRSLNVDKKLDKLQRKVRELEQLLNSQKTS